MQAMISGAVLVTAFAAAAGASVVVAVRLYRVSGAAARADTATRAGAAVPGKPARSGRRATQDPPDA